MLHSFKLKQELVSNFVNFDHVTINVSYWTHKRVNANMYVVLQPHQLMDKLQKICYVVLWLIKKLDLLGV
jgi:hypothetical protein